MTYLSDNIHDEDFQAMTYNVMAVPLDENILDHFPSLKMFKEFEPTFLEDEGIDHNSVLRYIFLMYQKRTPLMKIDDLIERKLEAARMAGLPFDENGMPHPYIDQMLKGQLFIISEMIIRLVRMQGNLKFASLMIGTEAFYKKHQAILADVDMDGINKSETDIEKVKGELWKQALQMQEQLDRLALELLNEDNNPYLKEDLFCIVDREQSKLSMPTPERIAAYGKEAI